MNNARTPKSSSSSTGVCIRLGISLPTLWRYRNDEKLNFPRPRRIRNRNYWDDDELEAWIDAQRRPRSVKKNGSLDAAK